LRRDKLQYNWRGCKLVRQTIGQLGPALASGETELPKEKTTCFFSYDDSFSVFFYACASRSYDAFFSYHKAYSNNFFRSCL